MQRSRVLACAVLACSVLSGCQNRINLTPHENTRPFVKFTRAPQRSGDLYDYSYQMDWTGFDPDGEVTGFVYAIDPPAPSAAVPEPDTAWVATTAFGGSFQFHATAPLPGTPGTPLRAAGFHVFVLEAVDDHGLRSVPAIVAFNSSTIAPSVSIVSPIPSSRSRTYVPPSFVVTWEGSDLDGVHTHKPVAYRVKLLTASTPITPQLLSFFPDTLLNYYVPRGWATWDSLGPDVSAYTIHDLLPQQDFVFVVIAFDEAGAYTPYVSPDVNALQFRSLYASNGGPRITIFNDFFTYTYLNPVYAPADSRTWVELEVPAGIPLDFHWTAALLPGAYIKAYRWVLDAENLDDDTPRTNERTDTSHWSVATSDNQSATIGPFDTARDHFLYVEADDTNGLRSLGIVHFTVAAAAFDRPLAICDDTRLPVDRRSPGTTGCIDQPIGRFPTAAELDTFLYARGGVPIRCYPAGSVSRRGLFRSYDFDTLNMRTGRSDLTPSLTQLARYRHLIWLVNPSASTKTGGGSDISNGMTALAYMNAAGHLNSLAAYLKMGGEVWLAGGGALSAAAFPWNDKTNDHPGLLFVGGADLLPGRFVYDVVHWRSEIRPSSGPFQLRRSLGRLADAPGPYASLPDLLPQRSLAAGDSMPPWRTNTGDFYLTTFDVEAMDLPNSIVENYGTPQEPDLRSTLDTLITVSGGTFAAGGVVMTVYHGKDNNRVIATGFDLWTYNRTQLQKVIDTVLQGIWGLAPQSLARVRAQSSAGRSTGGPRVRGDESREPSTSGMTRAGSRGEAADPRFARVPRMRAPERGGATNPRAARGSSGLR